MPNRFLRPRLRRPSTSLASRGPLAIALALAASVVGTAAAVAARQPVTHREPVEAPEPDAVTADVTVTMWQSAVTYDAASNTSRVVVTVSQANAVVPWTWSVAVRGKVVATGTTSDASVSVTVTNDCAITTKSVTAHVTDIAGSPAHAASTLDASLCPPPPEHRYERDRILSRPTLSRASFVDRLRAADSPALRAGPAIYRRLVRAGVNPAFALGMFHAESHSGTRGYAVTTRNWGNILFYSWTRKYGATPYAPGNGYTYAKFPTWRASVRALGALFNRYWDDGYRKVGSTSARWLGAREGSARHQRYLDNIVAAMTILPDDARPAVTRLTFPSKRPRHVRVRWSATDNRGVTGYQVKHRKGSHPWSARESLTAGRTVLALGTGTWTIAVRATDAAGNWSPWRSNTVKVHATRH